MPLRTGFLFHERFLDHDTGPGHPERPDRLRSIMTHLDKTGLLEQLQRLPVADTPGAAEESILKAHSKEHVALVRDSCRRGARVLDDGDTRVCTESFDAAL